MEIRGAAALVSGAASGIGRGTAGALGAAGADAAFVPADVTDWAAIRRAFAAADADPRPLSRPTRRSGG